MNQNPCASCHQNPRLAYTAYCRLCWREYSKKRAQSLKKQGAARLSRWEAEKETR